MVILWRLRSINSSSVAPRCPDLPSLLAYETWDVVMLAARWVL